MASTAVLKPDPQKFPVGTTVKAYKRSNMPGVWDRSGAPAGSQDASATVASDGSVTFTGLTADTDYLLYAASPDRWSSFSTKVTAGATPAVGAADATTQGIVKLAGDLGGTADAPTVPGLAGKAPLGAGNMLYGDGSDGNVTVSTTVTLTRDMFYDTLTISGTGRVKTAGYRVFCKTALVVAVGGRLDCDGTAGVGILGGAPGSNSNQSSLGYGEASAPNGTGQTVGTASAALTNSLGGKGGDGGAGASGAGGAGGAATPPASTTGQPLGPRAMTGAYYGAIIWQQNRNIQYSLINGGTNGGAGGGDGTVNPAGGGGGSGQVVVVFAKTITINGALSARGAAGGDGGVGKNSGGGGGGGGGVVIVVCESYAGNAPDVTGGAGGAKTGTGVAGSAGAAGTAILLKGS